MADYSYAGLAVTVRADTRELTKEIKHSSEKAGEEAGKTIGRKIGAGIGGAAKTATGMLTSVATLAGAGAAGLLVESVKAGVAYNKVYDQGMRAFKAVLGTDAAAKQLMGTISELAEKSPFPKEALIEASQQMLAFGFKAKDVEPTLDAIQNAMAATGKGTEGITNVIAALGRVNETGKFSTKTLTLLSSQGIDAMGMLAKGMGVSVAQVQKDIKSKTFDSKAALEILTKQMEVTYAGQAAKVNNTWAGAKNHIEEAMIGVGSAIAAPFIGPTGGGLAVEWANKFAELMEKLAPLVTPLTNALMQSLAPAIDAVNKGFDKMIGYAEQLADPKHLPAATDAVKKYGAAGLALAGVGTTLGGLKLFEELPLVGPLLESIVKPFEKVTEKVVEFGKETGKGLLPKALAGGAEAEGGEAAAAAISAPVAAALAAFALMMAASPKFRAAVIGLGKDLITALKPVFLAIWNGIKLIIPFVMMLAKMLGDNLAPIVVRIAVLLVPLGKILGLIIGTWFKLLALELKFLMPILGWALGLLGKVLLWLTTPLLWLADALKFLLPWVAIAAAAISRFADAAGTKVIPIFRAIGAVLKAVWGGIVETIRIAVAVIKTIIYVEFILIKAYITVVWLVIRTATRLLWDWFGPYIKAVWNAVLIVARVVWRAIAGAITGVWHVVTTALKAAFNWIKSAMSAAWNWARSTTIRLWHAIVAPLVAFWAVVKGPISKALSWIKGVLSDAWSFLVSTTARLWDAITLPLRMFWSVIKGPIVKALDWIKQVFSDAWNSLITAVSGVAGSIIDGLKSGFTTALKDIGKWLNANVVQPIISHIKGFFGINSPSTVMAEVGVNLIKGLFTGMVPGIKDLGGMVLKIFGSWPAALGRAIEKGLLGLAGLPGKALSALGKVGGWFAGLFGGGGGGSVKAGAGVQQWAGTVAQVLAMLGHPELQNLILAQMTTESGGDPNAINLTDSNARAGHPSQGLMQVIPSTFAAYAGPFRSRGILDPLANIYAGVAYALARYGANIGNVLGHGHGYAQGGIIREPVWGMGLKSGQPYSLGEAGPEAVLSAEQLRKLYALLSHPLGRIVLGQALPASLMPAGKHPAQRLDAHALHLAHVAHLAHLYALAHPAPVRTYRAPSAGFSGGYSTRAATGTSSAERAEQQRYTNLFRAHAEQPIINVYPRESQSEEQIAANVSARLAWAAQGGMR